MKTKRLLAVSLALSAISPASAQDGSYDPTFGIQGRDWIDVTSAKYDGATTMIQLANGDFFLGGTCSDTNPTTSCAAWLTPDGVLANGYGTSAAGTAWFKNFPAWPSDDNGMVSAVGLPDNRVVVAVSRASGASYLAMIRADGTGLDSSVGNGAGYVAPTFAVAQISRTPQGQFIAVGNRLPNDDAMVVARFNADLRLDTSFGTAGTTAVTFSDGDSYAFSMTLQRDGKIVLAGEAGDSGAMAIVRLTAQGQPDPNFGINSDGKFENNFGLYQAFSTSVVEDEKGRLVFSGGSRVADSSAGNWIVGRLLPGGAMDPSFNGGNLEVFVPSGSGTLYQPSACCLAIQSDNHIVAGGTYNRSDGIDKYFAMVRFNDNGAFDSTFGAGGRTYGDMSPEPDSRSDSPAAMVIVPGGIVIAGTTQVTSNEARFSAAKIKIDLLYASDFE